MNQLPQDDQASSNQASNQALSKDLQLAIARIKNIDKEIAASIKYAFLRKGVMLKPLKEFSIGAKYGRWIVTNLIEVEGGVFNYILRCSSCGYVLNGRHRFINPEYLRVCPKCFKGVRQ